jgi:DNA-binding NtrC family response regulator
MDKKTVLIVDDEENIRLLFQDIFEREGFTVYAAASGQEAMELFQKFKPQACIIDVHMPFSEFDGIEVLKRIKDLEKKTICTMVTRIDDAEIMNKAAYLGAEEYLIKPVRLEMLQKLVERLKTTEYYR